MAIIGRTGSGKTHAALFQLSQRNFHEMPWIVFDYKIDDLINEIEGAEYISMDLGGDTETMHEQLPKLPGLYIVQPEPDQDIEDFLRAIWRKRDTGVYVDEGYMIGQHSKSFRLLLTQGRSRRTPVITLTQRPVGMDRFALSEADFFQVFSLIDEDDRKRVEKYVPFNLAKTLPKWHSFWYDVKANEITVVGPAPSADVILDTFERRLAAVKENQKVEL